MISHRERVLEKLLVWFNIKKLIRVGDVCFDVRQSSPYEHVMRTGVTYKNHQFFDIQTYYKSASSPYRVMEMVIGALSKIKLDIELYDRNMERRSKKSNHKNTKGKWSA